MTAPFKRAAVHKSKKANPFRENKIESEVKKMLDTMKNTTPTLNDIEKFKQGFTQKPQHGIYTPQRGIPDNPYNRRRFPEYFDKEDKK